MSCIEVGVAVDSRSCRVGGCFVFGRCCRNSCFCGCSSKICEAESAPLVDVDLVPTEGEVDASAQVCEGWSQDRKVCDEAEGPEQIGTLSSRGDVEC